MLARPPGRLNVSSARLAGSFGFEKGKYDVSVKVGERSGSVALGAAESPSTFGTQHMFYMDQFNYASLNPNYFCKNNWYADGLNLVAVPTRAGIFLANPGFSGCTQCILEQTVRSSGSLNPLSPAKGFLYGWYANHPRDPDQA